MSDDKILDFDPAQEENVQKPNTITLVDEDGNEVEMAVVTVMEHEGSNYLILLPEESLESGNMEIAILKVEIDEQTGEETFVTGDTPDYDAVFDKFQAMLEEEAANMDFEDLDFEDEIPSLNPES